MMPRNLTLFPDSEPAFELPAGMRYEPGFLALDEEEALVADLRKLSFRSFTMHGVEAKRHVAHFGLSYEYNSGASKPGDPMPAFILALRERVGAWMEQDPTSFVEALVNEYPVGAGIGWHVDAPQFGEVVGVSLLSSSRFKLRPLTPSSGTPVELAIAPRSIYLLSGEVRWQWQHHIPPAKEPRYSITFRTLREPNDASTAPLAGREGLSN